MALTTTDALFDRTNLSTPIVSPLYVTSVASFRDGEDAKFTKYTTSYKIPRYANTFLIRTIIPKYIIDHIPVGLEYEILIPYKHTIDSIFNNTLFSSNISFNSVSATFIQAGFNEKYLRKLSCGNYEIRLTVTINNNLT